MNESSAAAAAAAAAPPTRVGVPGGIVAAPADGGPLSAASQAPERQDAGAASLGELISRERRRHAETREAQEPLTDAAGARVCCVLCFNRNAGLTVEDAG